MIFFFIVASVTLLASDTSGYTIEGCDSPQYLEIGSRGVVNCFFNGSQSVVQWCNNTCEDGFWMTLIANRFIDEMTYKSYFPGEYDLYPNGSLIIYNVSIEHEQNYTAYKADSPALEEIISCEVNVVTTVKPNVSHPVVDQCKSNETSCFVEGDRTTTLRCDTRNTRPAVDLEWYMPTAHGRLPQLSSNYTDDGITYTSETNITGFLDDSSLLSLLVCKGNSQPPLLQQNKVYVLTENIDTSVEVQSVEKLFELGSTVILSCSETMGELVVWKKSENLTSDFNVLAFLALNISRSYSEEYKLDSNGSLIIHSVKQQDKGFYQCAFQNDVTMAKRLFHAKVYDKTRNQCKGYVPSWILCVIPIVFFGTLAGEHSLRFMLRRLRCRGTERMLQDFVSDEDPVAEYRD